MLYIDDFLSRRGEETQENFDQTMLEMVYCVNESNVWFSDEF